MMPKQTFMKKSKVRILTLIILLGAFIVLKADTYYKQKTKCPYCNKKFTVTLMGSMSTFGSYKDYQKHGAIGTYYELLIKSCPRCKYSGYYREFDKPRDFTSGLRDSIQSTLDKYKVVKITDNVECEIAADLYKLYGESNDAIANLYLCASYILKFDSIQYDLRKQYQNYTIEYLKLAKGANEYEKDETYAVIDYLIGELYRRVGEFEQSIKYFDMASQNKNRPDWIDEVIMEQKELSKNGDDNNEI